MVVWSYGVKTFEYEFCTRTWKTFNQNIISNKYSILIGLFWSMSTNLVFQSFFYRETRLTKFSGCRYRLGWGYISVMSWRSVLLMRKPEKKPTTCRSHWKTWSLKLISTFLLYQVHLAMSEIQTLNFSGDRHWLLWYVLIQLPYIHGQGPYYSNLRHLMKINLYL